MPGTVDRMKKLLSVALLQLLRLLSLPGLRHRQPNRLCACCSSGCPQRTDQTGYDRAAVERPDASNRFKVLAKMRNLGHHVDPQENPFSRKIVLAFGCLDLPGARGSFSTAIPSRPLSRIWSPKVAVCSIARPARKSVKNRLRRGFGGFEGV